MPRPTPRISPTVTTSAPASPTPRDAARPTRTPVRRALGASLLGILVVGFFASGVAPAVAGGKDRDATRWLDRDVGFRIERADSEHWHFRGPRRDSDTMRLEIEHHIGGKKDRIRVQIWAWDLTRIQGGESVHLERWRGRIREQLSEIAEEKTDERDRFGRYRTRSYSAYGRLEKDETQIRRMTAHVFKTRGHLYTIFIVHEPEMDEKYDKDLRVLERSFRAS